MKRTQKKQTKRPTPFPIRLTTEEREELNRRAGEKALGTYIKSILFTETGRRRRGPRAPVRDHKVLAEILACLGTSRISQSLQQLADAAETGTLRWDDDAPATIKKACEDVCVMRLLLMRALGFQIQNEADQWAEQSVSLAFARASMDDEVSS